MYFTEQNLNKFDFKKILSSVIGKEKAASIGKKTTKVLHTKGGKLMMAAGAIATVVPVVGWIAGPIISAGGAQLDKAQKAKLAKKLVEKKEPELLQIKEEMETGQLTDKEYETKVIDTLEESAQEVRTETIKKIETRDRETAARSSGSSTSMLIGGGVAAAVLAMLAMRNK